MNSSTRFHSHSSTAATLHGWWMARERAAAGYTPPITASADADDVKLTAFVRHGEKVLIVLASFAAPPESEHGSAGTNVVLSIDWSAIGLDAATAKLSAPQLLPMQPNASAYAPGDSILVPPGQGVLLILE